MQDRFVPHTKYNQYFTIVFYLKYFIYRCISHTHRFKSLQHNLLFERNNCFCTFSRGRRNGIVKTFNFKTGSHSYNFNTVKE